VSDRSPDVAQAATVPPARTIRERASIITGDDGVTRCGWAGTDAEYTRYHDEEWGIPLHGDQPLFEKISLEGFQAGLSWITILRRRDNFRAAFHGFDIARVAALTPAEADGLMLDTGIIRNRAKIEATIGNAAITLGLVRDRPGALDELLWGFAPPPRAAPPASLADIPAVTPESAAMSKTLRALGFRFVGPTTLYALMQSSGMVDDHVAGCFRAADSASA
jgi:DNA-3-methyladenine glycosylase I